MNPMFMVIYYQYIYNLIPTCYNIFIDDKEKIDVIFQLVPHRILIFKNMISVLLLISI